jgi:ParB family chromosome partitioning protein
MAKLSDTIKMSGINSGAQILGKMMRVSEIEEDPEISAMFLVHDGVFQAIEASMREKGFDLAQPVVIWKDKRIVVDGRTRLRAAKAAGLLEVPVVERDFESLDDAKLYCYKRQAERRNLSQAEIFTVAAELGLKSTYDGNGRGRELLAKDLGVSPGVIAKARTVAKHGSEEDIAAVKSNKLSINKAYEKLRNGKKNGGEKISETEQPEEDESAAEGAVVFPDGDATDSGLEGERFPIEPDLENIEEGGEEIEFGITDAYGLPGNVKFLKDAVILLIEHQDAGPARLLVDHFLKKKEKTGFYKLLPEKIRDTLLQKNGEGLNDDNSKN